MKTIKVIWRIFTKLQTAKAALPIPKPYFTPKQWNNLLILFIKNPSSEYAFVESQSSIGVR